MGECTLEHCKNIGQFRYSFCISVFEYCHYSMFSLYSVCILFDSCFPFHLHRLLSHGLRLDIGCIPVWFYFHPSPLHRVRYLIYLAGARGRDTGEEMSLFSSLDLNSRANRTFWVIFAFAFTQFILVNVYYFFGWK